MHDFEDKRVEDIINAMNGEELQQVHFIVNYFLRL